MPIPKLTRSHVEKALAEIDRSGIPPGRRSTKFVLVVNGKNYPPKYVVSLAAMHATGRALDPSEFSGGAETNNTLSALGFTVVGPQPTSGSSKPVISPTRRLTPPASVPQRQPRTSARPTEGSGDISLTRLVTLGRSPESAGGQEAMLIDALDRLSGRSKFMITPGGFVRGDFPKGWRGRTSWASSAADLKPLVEHAEKRINKSVTRDALRKARGKVDVLTVGIDLFQDPEHVELVAVYDVPSAKIVRWTGKSYPTTEQEADLVQIIDLRSHLLEIAGERVLVLGCHDLNMWSPRGWANQSEGSARRQRCDAMRKVAASFRPTVVLQHPHSTDTANIWAVAWSGIRTTFPAVTTWGSGIGYYARSGRPRGSVESVLARTRGEGAKYLDIKLPASGYD